MQKKNGGHTSHRLTLGSKFVGSLESSAPIGVLATSTWWVAVGTCRRVEQKALKPRATTRVLQSQAIALANFAKRIEVILSIESR